MEKDYTMMEKDYTNDQGVVVQMVTFLCDEERISSDRQFFYEMLPYVSPKIVSVDKDDRGIAVACRACDEGEVRAQIEILYGMVERGGLKGREVPVKTLEDYSGVPVANEESIFEQLLARGDVREMAHGSYAYSGLFLKALQYFDAKIEDYGRATFPSICEHDFPVLHPISRYEQGGYFENFPHYMMFQTSLKNDIQVLDRFAREGVGDGSVFEQTRTPENVLRHAACVPVYEMLEGATVPSDAPLEFLVSGTCFRNEGANVFELARINEFHMKEYVFVGSPEQCSERMANAKLLWDFWRETFSANTKLDTANDSFFASNYKKLKFFQVLGDSKREFKWKIPAHSSYISCGSMNFHRTHFSKPFSIRNEARDYCYTSCFAFGVERLAFAVLSQKGLDVDAWDDPTRAELARYVEL